MFFLHIFIVKTQFLISQDKHHHCEGLIISRRLLELSTYNMEAFHRVGNSCLAANCGLPDLVTNELTFQSWQQNPWRRIRIWLPQHLITFSMASSLSSKPSASVWWAHFHDQAKRTYEHQQGYHRLVFAPKVHSLAPCVRRWFSSCTQHLKRRVLSTAELQGK